MKKIHSEKVQPIFVLGAPRSGTTWLTNILASHPNVFTPQHEQHYGQHESAYFSNLLCYCRWGKSESDRLALSAIFERSDYWHLLFPNCSPTLDITKLGVNGYFREAMDQAARMRGCTHWTENTPTHTLMLHYLIQAFPDAVFLAIIRRRDDVICSHVYKFGNPNRLLAWVKASIRTEIYFKIIHLYQKRITLISYETLLTNFKEEKRRISFAINLALEDSMHSQWEANSSYGLKRPSIPLGCRFSIMLISYLFKLIPSRIAECLVKIWFRFHQRPLAPWFFRVYRGKKSAQSYFCE
jgi:hypothetical protein